MSSNAYALPWPNVLKVHNDSSAHEDSAFHEYSNPTSSNGNSFDSAGDNSCLSSPCPDYEEVHQSHQSHQSLQRGMPAPVPKRSPVRLLDGLNEVAYVYNLASAAEESTKRSSSVEGITSILGATVMDNKADKEKIMTSTVFCIHKDEGCSWSGPLNKLKAHLNTCQKDAVSCPNACSAKIARLMMEDHMLYTCVKRLVACQYCKRDFTGGAIDDHQAGCGFEPVHCDNKCGARIARNRLKAHRVNTCSKRLVRCQYCERSFTAETLQAHHRKCNLFPVPCPNRCPVGSLAREDVESHLESDCLASKQFCQFRHAGCPFESGSRAALADHVAAAPSAHLDLMCALARQQQAHIDRLSGQLERAALTSYDGILTWKIRDFSAKMEEARSSEGGLELVSLPFFTSQSGYKLQASLFINGNGGGEGTHMSVYIKILPGEFDSILKWPFKHTVSFSLLDQSEDRRRACNVVESFIPDPNWPNFERPSREVDQLGFGFPKFVPHELLEEREYIKDDALFIKVRVDPRRNVAV